MDVQLLDKYAFDDYAAGFGWDYDNGGMHGGVPWDWYVSDAHCWDRNPDGTGKHMVVIMRREPEVAAVHIRVGGPRTEIWRGDVRTSVEFDRLVATIADYMASCVK